jgi:hypothetical protein
MSSAEQIDALVVLERHIGWLQGLQQQYLHALAEGTAAADPEAVGKQWVREDVACALKVSSPVARERLALAARLVTVLPATLDRLLSGSISFWYAKHLSDSVEVLTAKDSAEVEARVLTLASGQTFAEFTRSLRSAILRVDPSAAQKRHVYAVADRDVRKVDLPDGIAAIWAPLSADQAELVMAGIDTAAHTNAEHAAAHNPDDQRTIAQHRADALVELCTIPLEPSSDPTTALPHPAPIDEASGARRRVRQRDRRRPAVNVTVALSTLLGADDQPGELAGYGAISASMARRIAADPTGTWRRLVTDDLGTLIDYGRTKYRPPADLANHVIARDQTCVFPGCRRQARSCEIDHIVDWDYGGPTNEPNLTALCVRHHHAKHDARWRLSRDATTNVTTWTSPTGRIYRSVPPALPISGRLDRPPGRPKTTTRTGRYLTNPLAAVDTNDPPPF